MPFLIPKWRRSKRGNLTRRVGPYTLTVFRKYGRWCFCVDAWDARFDCGFGSEDEARDAAESIIEEIREQDAA